MRGRAKRQRRSSPGFLDSASGSRGGPHFHSTGSSSGPDFEVDTSHFECGSFASKCSVRLVHEVICSFDTFKRQLVCEIGFAGILHFPSFKQIHRKFALMLMTSVDEATCSLNIGHHIRIPFTSYDIGNVLGIPSSGLSVSHDSGSFREAKQSVLDNILGPEFKESRSIKYVQQLVQHEYIYPMTKDDIDRWKVAFVVFVVSNLLCPSAKHDYASIEYWNGIEDPDKICAYDWADYVRLRLLDAVTKLKQDLSSNIKFPSISGCIIFLQVFYLDSLDLGELTATHNSFPRVREFSFDKVRQLIDADLNFSRHLNHQPHMHVSQLRDRSNCVYTWAQCALEPFSDSRTCSLLAIWESVVAMVHLLNIPLEAAGPLFVAAFDFQEQINSGLSVTGTQAIKFMSVLVSIMIPYRRGTSSQLSDISSSDDGGCHAIQQIITNGTSLLSFPITFERLSARGIDQVPSLPAASSKRHYGVSPSSPNQSSSLHNIIIGDIVQQSFRSVFATLDDVPTNLNVNLRVSSAISHFYSVLESIRSPRGFDLNASLDGSPQTQNLPSPCFQDSSFVVPSPWELGYKPFSYNLEATSIFEKLKVVPDDESFVTIHSPTGQIRLSSCHMRMQFVGLSEFDADIFDVLTRSIRQFDDTLYAYLGQKRWRIFFQSDFMGSILSHSGVFSTASIKKLVHNTINSVNISVCHHIFFPALLQCRWVCFVWSVRDNLISVFEPSYFAQVPRERVEAIERSCFKLKLALDIIARSFTSLHTFHCGKISMRILTLPQNPSSCFNRSGVLCSHFCRYFDGTDLLPKLSKIDCDVVASSLLAEFYSLKDNLASFPHDLG